MKPANFICPESPREAAQIVAEAARKGRPVIPCGQLGRLGFWPGLLESEALFISGRALPKDVKVEPDNLLAVVPAGLTLAELDEILKPTGLYWPVTGPWLAARSLGALMSEGAVGLESMARGRLIDWILGLGMIGPGGQLIHSGGRTLKNVSGYDLTRLLWKSWGRLGFSFSFILKLLPRPKCKKLAAVELPKPKAGLELARKLILEKNGLSSLRLVYSRSQGWRLLLAWDGFPEAVDFLISQFGRLAGELNWTLVDLPEIFWAENLGGWPLMGPRQKQLAGDRRAIFDLARELIADEESDFKEKADLDLGGGLARLMFKEDVRPPEFKGVHLDGPRPGGEVWRRVKAGLDPDGIFFPKRLWPAL